CFFWDLLINKMYLYKPYSESQGLIRAQQVSEICKDIFKSTKSQNYMKQLSVSNEPKHGRFVRFNSVEEAFSKFTNSCALTARVAAPPWCGKCKAAMIII
uniref:Uncharacterized protein n=1 Tax=Paramormyrops kingsleyae TaxID=1676925 RepID=A0A3B3TEX2_9TELE